MENLTIKCLDMIFLTDLWFMNIIRLLRHQRPPKNWKRLKKFLKAKSKATNQFYQILIIFLAFLNPLDPKIQPLPYFWFWRPLRPKRLLKGQKLLTLERGKVKVKEWSPRVLSNHIKWFEGHSGHPFHK